MLSGKSNEGRDAMIRLKWLLQFFMIFYLISTNVFAAGSMIWPVKGEITSDYGYRVSPGGGVGSMNHKSIDIGGEYG